MKRLASVFLFLLMAALAFFGILRFARQQAEVKAEKMNPSEYVTVYTDMPKGMLEALGNDFFQESGLKMNVVYLSKSQLQSRQDASDTPAADLYITSQDSLMKMKKENMLVPYASAQTDTALNLFKDEECYWTGLWVDPVVFAVNEDYARKHPAFSYSWNEVLTRNSLRLSMTDFVAADMAEDLLIVWLNTSASGKPFLFWVKPRTISYSTENTCPRLPAWQAWESAISVFPV